jgi:predicted methyltransferase
MERLVRRTISAALIVAATFATSNIAIAKTVAASSSKATLAAAVAAPSRTPANVARDKYRKPAETLAFIGIKPTHHVVEIWPGGGWYTEILAPFLHGQGKLTVATVTGRGANFFKKLEADAAVYGKVERANFPTFSGGTPVPPGTADAVLTFRNVHNWTMGMGDSQKRDYGEAAFRELYTMLKPGGVLGIEEHRLAESADPALERTSGYLKVSTVRALAEKAGFKFAGSSEVNANPRDTKDYSKGVWTLPPSFAEGDTDKAKYAAIGESDRMTLKFVKPLK